MELRRPELVYQLDLDAREGLSRPARASASFRAEGDAGVGLRLALRQLSAADRERALREFWRREYGFVTPETVSSSNDPDGGRRN